MSQGPANRGRNFGGGFDSNFRSDDAKEQVRQATDIVDLVGSYLQLRRQGRNYVGLCPWHDDSKPSLQVNPERQTFKCWVCDLGGDVFSFLMKMDNLEFREALEQLADRAGIALARQGPAAAPGSPGDKKTLLAAAAWAEEQFARCLLTDPAAEPARRYLIERGITQESIARFRLGFAPDRWDWLLGEARSTPFSPAVLERIGLVRPRQQGEGYYDFYRGRVIFPIRDVRSRPIAFGGRILPEFAENAGGKYINSPETPLFSKSNQLFALDLARDAIASEKKIVVTEGYTDVIMAHQHGVENVVAVLGTALGEKHLPLIRRFTERIVLVLDGDEAGQRRTNEVLELFVANQVDLRILGLPGGLDPCDFIATPDGATSVAGGEAKDGLADGGRGPEAFRRLVDQAPDALEHKMQTVTNGLVASADTHTIAQAVEQFLATLSKVRTGLGDGASVAMIREQSLLGRLARWAQLPEATLRQRLVDLRRSSKNGVKQAIAPPASSPASPPSSAMSPEQAFAEAGAADAEDPGLGSADQPAPLDTRLDAAPPRERELLELLLAGDAPARRVLEVVRVEELTSPAAACVYKLCSELLLQRGSIAFNGLLDAADESVKNLLVSIDDEQQQKSESSLEQRVDDLVAAFARVRDESHRRGAVAALQGDHLDNHQKEEVLNELFAKLRDRQTGPLSMDG